MKRITGVALAMMLLLGACGDGDGDSPGGDAATEGESTTTTEAEGDAAAEEDEGEDGSSGGIEGDEDDLGIAESALLTEDDFPAGWTGSPRDEEEDDSPSIDDCEPLREYKDSETAKARGDEFSKDQAEITVNVVLMPDADEAAGYLEAFQSDETDQCIQDFLDETIREAFAGNAAEGTEGTEGAAGGAGDDVQITTEPAEVDGFGDDAAGYKVTMDVTSQGQNVQLHGEFVLVQVDRGLGQFSFLNVAEPITEPRDELFDAVAGRLEDALL